jgi:RNA polymerase sigma factor FliA
MAEPTAGTRSRSRPDTEAGKHSVDESAAEIAELWQQYKERSTAEARERLILHYSPLVKFVAGRVAAGLPQNIEQSDLVSYGIFGLIDAIDKFDPGRGYKFETYAISRIKGAIIDELRSIDWVPRSVRAKARAIERAYSKLENELRRSPDDKEVAAELGVTENELATTLGQISFVGVVALDELLSAGSERGSGATVGDTIAGGGHDPVEAFESEEMRQVLADAINRMPDRERLVLTLYYYEGLTLAEIGNVLGVTESRVCQIHTKAIFQLRSRLSEPMPERGLVT